MGTQEAAMAAASRLPFLAILCAGVTNLAAAEPALSLNSVRRTMAGRVPSPSDATLPRASAPTPVLPALPEGVAELKFEDFFRLPVGPKGLELTEKVRALDGRRVRILGWQVVESVSVCNSDPNAANPKRKFAARFEACVPGRLLLCSTPQVVDFNHYGHCEDLPPQVLYVTVPEYYGQPVPHTPGMLLLTGTLEMGNRTEPDGRISSIRLTLDPRAATSSTSMPANSDGLILSQAPTQ